VLEEKTEKGLIYKKMKAEGVTFIAMIDSGCDLCLMREDIFKSSSSKVNCQVERIHKIVIPMLSKMCQENPLNWYRHVR